MVVEPEDEASGRRTENQTESRLLAHTIRASKYWEPIDPLFFFSSQFELRLLCAT